jgi:hypothetical protein
MAKLVIGVLIAASVSAAHAESDVFDYSWDAPEMRSGIGISVVAGGGVMGYASSTVRNNTTSVGGLWQVRASLGTHIPIGLDLGYVGTATGINSQFGTASATLLSTNLEGALRWNILPHMTWNPYVFGGVGWAHLDVTGAAFTRTDAGIMDRDNEIIFPVGVGIGWRSRGGIMVDLRGTYRIAGDDNLIVVNPGQIEPHFASMDWWEASAAGGFEF